ncbi:MAG: hypothetical protein AB7V04_04875 [Desulfomonilaceae bacterium]
MKFRTIIAIALCIVILGTSSIPASMMACCCSAKKQASKCGSCPLPELTSAPPSCCQSKGSAGVADPITQNPLSKSCGFSSSQASVKCMCSSQTKAPVLTDFRAPSCNQDDSNSISLLKIETPQDFHDTYRGYLLAISSSNIIPILQSCSLRI